MILLADGGSTKVEWCLSENGRLVKQVYTKGMNPYFRNKEELYTEIVENLLPQLGMQPIDAVYFYGAGCAFPEKNEVLRNTIIESLGVPVVQIASDLLGAARGLCGKNAGIVCIMGTGSNSCFYDGNSVIHNVSPLGYILGDEGSGAVLGKLFLGACFKNQLTGGIREKFIEEYKFTVAEILDKVYRQPMPNRFLADICYFINENIGDSSVYELVYHSFREFFIRNVMQYEGYNIHEVYFTGSVAFHFQDILYRIAEELGIRIKNILPSPMEGLIKYYK